MIPESKEGIKMKKLIFIILLTLLSCEVFSQKNGYEQFEVIKIDTVSYLIYNGMNSDFWELLIFDTTKDIELYAQLLNFNPQWLGDSARHIYYNVAQWHVNKHIRFSTKEDGLKYLNQKKEQINK